jgi:hypothetical protein
MTDRAEPVLDLANYNGLQMLQPMQERDSLALCSLGLVHASAGVGAVRAAAALRPRVTRFIKKWTGEVLAGPSASSTRQIFRS